MANVNSSGEPNSADSNGELESYLPASEVGELIIEVPVSPTPFFIQPPLPSGMTPLGRIAAEGELYRNLSKPHTPKWVTLASWPILGLPALFLLGIALAGSIDAIKQAYLSGADSTDVILILAQLLPAVFFSALLLTVLAKGTLAQIRRS